MNRQIKNFVALIAKYDHCNLRLLRYVLVSQINALEEGRGHWRDYPMRKRFERSKIDREKLKLVDEILSSP